MAQEPDWGERLAGSIAEAVQRYRKERGLSAQRLADRCAELGFPINRSVIANFESGRRLTISVPELFILAKALEVPPILILFPVEASEPFEGLPGIYGTPMGWVSWFSGDDTFGLEARDGWLAGHPINKLRRLAQLEDELNAVRGELMSLWTSGGYDPNKLARAQERAAATAAAAEEATLLKRRSDAELQEKKTEDRVLAAREIDSLVAARIFDRLDAERNLAAQLELYEAFQQKTRELFRKGEDARFRYVKQRIELEECGIPLPPLPKILSVNEGEDWRKL